MLTRKSGRRASAAAARVCSCSHDHEAAMPVMPTLSLERAVPAGAAVVSARRALLVSVLVACGAHVAAGPPGISMASAAAAAVAGEGGEGAAAVAGGGGCGGAVGGAAATVSFMPSHSSSSGGAARLARELPTGSAVAVAAAREACVWPASSLPRASSAARPHWWTSSTRSIGWPLSTSRMVRSSRSPVPFESERCLSPRSVRSSGQSTTYTGWAR
mmetsp:Transcript_35737/g.105641  ORF Transcript_35737/g.105641 Transcript_35737/m.105641 type:complete len:216 (-) Transcript_35737:972-1619(-)